MSSVTSINTSTLTDYTSSASGATNLGEQDFLTLLVAQLEHQDPLNPQDNTEFIAQLAQFSSLEQQTTTNEKLDQLLTAQGSSEQTAAFALLGKQVIAAGDSFYLQGNEVALGFSIDQTAASANLTLTDEGGNSVASFSLDDLQEGDNFVSWDGCDSADNKLTNGTYSMTIEVFDSAGKAVDYQPLIKASVDEVTLDSSGSILVTDAGDIPLSSISSVVAQ